MTVNSAVAVIFLSGVADICICKSSANEWCMIVNDGRRRLNRHGEKCRV